MAESTITTFAASMATIATQVTDEMDTQTASLATGDMGPSSMITLMGVTSKFGMAIEALSSIQKSFGEGCSSPARKIA